MSPPVLSGSTPVVRAALKNPQNPVNVLSQPLAKVYLHLQFLDPGGVARDFPVDLPVKALFGTQSEVYKTALDHGANGCLTFPAKLNAGAHNWDSFTLSWDDETNHEALYLVCEEPGASVNTCEVAMESNLRTIATGKKRFFRLPTAWSLKNGDWSVGAQGFSGNGSFSNGVFQQNTPGTPADIGARATPVDLVLKPHWKFFQFVFFDRYWGPVRTGSPAPATHGGPGNRVSVPPLELEGFRGDANANTTPVDSAAYYSHSNWTVPVASNAQRWFQCLPWIKQFDDGHAALTPDLTGDNMGLRFQTPADSFVYSRSDTDREIVSVPAGDARLKCGPERLKYYDLPPMWRSRLYYARTSAVAGKFFGKLSKAEIDETEAKATAITFSLDDIVLYDDQPARQVAALGVNDKAVLFHHRMNQKLTGNENWIYKPATAADAPDPTELPYSKVVIPAPAPTSPPASPPPPYDPKEPPSYIFDYADWTRLVIAQGSLFDNFDQRCPDAPGDATRVTGARAAVRWVDETKPFTTGKVYKDVGGTLQLNGGANWPAEPGTLMWPGPDRADFGGGKHFQVQPFLQYWIPTRYSKRYDPTVGPSEQIGRFSQALLRCCDVEGADEVAIDLHYLKSYFDFAYPPPNGSVACTLDAAGQKNYALSASLNVAARWNGAETTNVQNASRAELLPTNLSPPLPLKIYVAWYCQSVAKPRAHCSVGVSKAATYGTGRDNRGTMYGTGESDQDGYVSGGAANWLPYSFAIAHESGHMDGLSDDYNERWWGNSYNQISFKANAPGDPYEPDGRTNSGGVADCGMMNGNSRMRNRYFWPAAEWAREALEGSYPNIRFKVKYTDPSGVVYDDYSIRKGSPRFTYLHRPLWAVLGPLDSPPVAEPASRAALPPPPSPPLPFLTNQFDLFLYQLGKDHYSSYILCRGLPAGSPPFDGILVVAIRLKLNLPANPNAAAEKTAREKIATAIAKFAEENLQRKWYAAGKFGAAGPNMIQFNRCLLHFVPQLMVNNHPNYVQSSPPAKDDPIVLASQLETTFGFNYFLKIASAASPPQPTVWDLATRSLFIDYNTAPNLALPPVLEDEFPKFLGVNKDVGSVVAADWVTLVRKILRDVTVFAL